MIASITAPRYRLLVAVQMAVSVLSYIPGARLAERVGRKPFVIATFVAFALFPVAVVVARNFLAMVLAFVVGGLRELGEPARKALIVDLVAKYGVDPRAILDFLAMVGDAADGYPGIEGIGKATAVRLVARYGHIEDFPAAVLDDEGRLRALLLKKLATLRTDAPLFANVDELKWQGPKDSFEQFASGASGEQALTRARKAADR